MKKLVIVLSLALAVSSVKAASVTWSISGDKSMVDYTAYAVLGATAQDTWESVDAIKAAALEGTGTFSGSRTVSAIGTSAGDALTKENADVYFVIVNKDGTQWSNTAVQNLTSLVYDPAAQESASGSATYAGAGLTYKDFGGGSDDPPGPGPDDPPGPGPDDPPTPGPGGDGDVPEPTSGLLLMIGGAALALRRRR